jgi:hypothetical protein
MPNFPLKKFQQHGIDACEHGVVTHLGDASVEKPTARARQYASPNSRTNPARIDSVHKVFTGGHKRSLSRAGTQIAQSDRVREQTTS